MISQFTESQVEAASDDLSIVLDKGALIELKNYLLSKEFSEIYDDLFDNLIINLDSIYLPNRQINMIPDILATDICSLHPGKRKLVFNKLCYVIYG